MNRTRLSAVSLIKKNLSKSFNIAIAYNSFFAVATAKKFVDHDTLSFYKASLNQLNLEGQKEDGISDKSFSSMYQNITEGKFMFFDEIFSNSSDFYYLEPCFCSPTADIVEALNTRIQERHYHSESFITDKVSERTQKVEI